MADKDIPPNFNPKHRIVGAIVIVALVVIFVPMLLSESEPPPEIKGARETPPRDATAETRVIVTPVAGEEIKSAQNPEAMTKTTTLPATTEVAPRQETKPAALPEKPAPAPAPAPAKEKEKPAKVAAAPEKITRGWVVQVGTFSNADNAAHLRDKLKSHGHTAYTETVVLAGKKALRLRVGPFRDKEQATKAQAQIRKELHVQGVIQSYP